MTVLRGRVHKYGANIDTDVIIPGAYLKEMDPKKLATHAMEGVDSEFTKKVKPGDFVVAGRNFGCGSSREHAPIALKYSGIKAVLAPTFARIFYRNAVDGGHLLPIEISDDAYSKIEKDDELEIDLQNGQIKNLSKGESYTMKPFPDIVLKIIQVGGLMNYTKP